MNQSIRTALALYSGGTLDLETAARSAGVRPEQLSRTARRLSVPTTKASETGRELERVRLRGD